MSNTITKTLPQLKAELENAKMNRKNAVDPWDKEVARIEKELEEAEKEARRKKAQFISDNKDFLMQFYTVMGNKEAVKLIKDEDYWAVDIRATLDISE